MYTQINPNYVHSSQLGNEQMVYFAAAPPPPVAPNMFTAAPMAPAPMQFPPGQYPHITAMPPQPPPIGYHPVTQLHVPVLAPPVPQPPHAPGNVLAYPCQGGYFPPVPQNTSGVFMNSQVQSYSMGIVPQQCIPVTNATIIMGQQQPTTPYIMHQEYLPIVPNNYPGYTPALNNRPSFQPQYIPNEMHTRQTMYQMSTVQQTHCIPRFPKALQQIPFQVEQRGLIFNQETIYEQPETTIHQRSVEHEIDTSNTPKNTINQEENKTSPCLPLQDEQSTDLESSFVPSFKKEEATECNAIESVQSPVQYEPTDETEITTSPSEITLVSSPLSSDGLPTVCNSPSDVVTLDSDEEVFSSVMGDEIPTKDTSSITAFPSHQLCPDYIFCPETGSQVKPQTPYSDVKVEPQVQGHKPEYAQTMQDQTSSRDTSPHCTEGKTDSSSPSVDSYQSQSPASDKEIKVYPQFTQADMKQQQPIRSLIDTPLYNTGYSRVLTQLSQPASDRPKKQACSSSSSDRATKRPLTTHFRLLFKPIPLNAEKDGQTG